MPLIPFVRRVDLQVTVRPDGRFMFNVAASEYLSARSVSHLALSGDASTQLIQLRPADAQTQNPFWVSYGRRPNGKLGSATISGTPFLRWLGIWPDASRRYSLTVDEDGSTLSFNMAKPLPEPAVKGRPAL